MNKIRYLLKTGIASFAILASGCGSVLPTIPAPKLPTVPLDELKLLASGKWVSPCALDAASSLYFNEEFSLTETLNVTRVKNYFTDSACSIPAYSIQESGTAQLSPISSLEVEVAEEHEHDVESEEKGQCEVGDAMPPEVATALGAPGHEADGVCDDLGRWKIHFHETHLEKRSVSVEEGMRALNMVLSSTKLTLHSESEALAFSAGSVCGKADWSAGVEVELSSDCDDSAKGVHHRRSGKKSYDVYKVEGESLLMGDDSLQTEAPEVKRKDRRKKGEDQVENDRPTTVDRNHGYEKHPHNESL